MNVSTINSTTDRTNLAPRSVRLGVEALSKVSPAAAARALSRLWFTPPRRALDEASRQVLAGAERVPVSLDGRRVAVWMLGNPASPAVLLVHGWGGRGAQLLSFAPPLVERGFRVVLFDALGHGRSDPSPLGWHQASFVDAARCMLEVERRVGRAAALIAHSGGAIATGIALGLGLRVERAALVAPMARPLRHASSFDTMFAVTPEVGRRWRALAADRARFTWDGIDLTTAPARHPVPRALVVHDQGDREVPFADGEAIADAWPGATFVPTQGLGHQRILRDPDVVARVASFLT